MRVRTDTAYAAPNAFFEAHMRARYPRTKPLAARYAGGECAFAWEGRMRLLAAGGGHAMLSCVRRKWRCRKCGHHFRSQTNTCKPNISRSTDRRAEQKHQTDTATTSGILADARILMQARLRHLMTLEQVSGPHEGDQFKRMRTQLLVNPAARRATSRWRWAPSNISAASPMPPGRLMRLHERPVAPCQESARARWRSGAGAQWPRHAAVLACGGSRGRSSDCRGWMVRLRAVGAHMGELAGSRMRARRRRPCARRYLS